MFDSSVFFLVCILLSFSLKSNCQQKKAWEINLELSSDKTMFGDMLLTPAQILRYETANQLQIRGVSVKSSRFNRWENNTIPIVISPQYTNNQKSILQKSLKTFEEISCFKFVERTNQWDYLFIVPLDGCYSYVGKIGGRQTLSLAVDCIADYIIWHEMMHAIGFEHEHQRPDRDSFIRVDYQNVIPNQLINFDKLHDSLVDYPDNYDYKSIMHYDGYAFGKIDSKRQVRLATMIPLKSGIELEDNMKFTQIDINKLNRLGNCSPKTQIISGIELTTKKPECKDVANNCETSRRRGMCKNQFYRQMMMKSCQKTCNFCYLNRDSPTAENNNSEVSLLSECVDTHSRCAIFSQNGFCTNIFYEKVRSKLCSKTCNLC